MKYFFFFLAILNFVPLHGMKRSADNDGMHDSIADRVAKRRRKSSSTALQTADVASQSLQLLDLPDELLSKIVACSKQKNNLRKTCRRFYGIALKNNPYILLHDPLVLYPRDAQYFLFKLAKDQGHESVIGCLLQCGASANCWTFVYKNDYKINERTVMKWYLLGQAAAHGNLSMVRTLLVAGAQADNGVSISCYDLDDSDDDSSCTFNGACSSLWLACYHGHIAVAEALLDAGAHIEYEGDGGSEFPDVAWMARTPLEVAAERGDLALTQLLLKRGASTKYVALNPVINAGHGDMLRILLEHGAQLPEHTKKHAIWQLIEKGDVNLDMIRVLMSAGAEVPSFVVNKVIDSQNVALLQLLVEHGIKVDSYTTISAIESQNVDMIALCLDHEGDPNSFDLYYAIGTHNIDIVSLYLEKRGIEALYHLSSTFDDLDFCKQVVTTLCMGHAVAIQEFKSKQGKPYWYIEPVIDESGV